MDKIKFIKALNSMAAGEKDRTKIAQLQDVFFSIEQALNAGVNRVAILKQLNEQGLNMTLKTFDNMIYQIRHKKKIEKINISQSVVQPDESISSSSLSDNLDNMDKKQRREHIGNQYIKPETSNPLLKRLQEKK